MWFESYSRVRWPALFTPGLLLAAVAASALALALGLAWFGLLGADGGRYSYPGYALAHGRDPSEHLLPIEDLDAGSAAVRVQFPFELRSSLLVLIHATWFTVAGTSLASIKAFGMLQWLLLSGLAWLAAWMTTRHLAAASIAAAATLSDAWVISRSTTNLRPDVPIAILLVATVTAFTRFLDSGRPGWLVTTLLGAGMLPLMDLSAVIATAFLGAFAIAAGGRGTGKRARGGALLVVLCLVMVTLLRQPLMDLLLPTALPDETEAGVGTDVRERWQRLAAMGIAGKLAFEFDRWRDYFVFTNLPQLALISIGVVALCRSGRSRPEGPDIAAGLLWATAAAVVVILVIDTAVPRSHILPIAVMVYVAAGHAFARGRWAWPSVRTRRAVLLLGLTAIAMRLWQTGDVVYRSRDAGLSNTGLSTFLHQVLEPGIDHTVVGPSYLWPYVQDVGSVTLIHPDAHPWSVDDPRWNGIHRLVIDTELRQRGWGAVVDEMVRCRALEWDGAIGTHDLLRIDAFRVTGARCARSMS